MKIVISILAIIATITVIMIVMYHTSPDNGAHVNKKHEIITESICACSVILFCIAIDHVSNTQRASHAQAYLQVDGERIHSTTAKHDDTNDHQIDKTFNKDGKAVTDIHVGKGAKVRFSNAGSNADFMKSNHDGDGSTIHKLSPTHYQVVTKYSLANDDSYNMFGSNIVVTHGHHKINDIDLAVSDNNAEARHYDATKGKADKEEEQKQEAQDKAEEQRAKAKAQAKWAKYKPLDASSLSGKSMDQLGGMKNFKISGKVVDAEESDGDSTQVIINVPNSDRKFFMDISNHTALKHHIASGDFIWVYGSYLDNQQEVTQSMVLHNNFSSDLYGDKLYTIEAPEKIVDKAQI